MLPFFCFRFQLFTDLQEEKREKKSKRKKEKLQVKRTKGIREPENNPPHFSFIEF